MVGNLRAGEVAITLITFTIVEIIRKKLYDHASRIAFFHRN